MRFFSFSLSLTLSHAIRIEFVDLKPWTIHIHFNKLLNAFFSLSHSERFVNANEEYTIFTHTMELATGVANRNCIIDTYIGDVVFLNHAFLLSSRFHPMNIYEKNDNSQFWLHLHVDFVCFNLSWAIPRKCQTCMKINKVEKWANLNQSAGAAYCPVEFLLKSMCICVSECRAYFDLVMLFNYISITSRLLKWTLWAN